MFILSYKEFQTIIAKFHCVPIDGYSWSSPPKAPFGGVILEKQCQENELLFFLNCIKEWLAGRSCRKLYVKTAPACYQPVQHDLLHRCYVNTGFTAIHTIDSHFILPNAGNFHESIHYSEQRRLKKSYKAEIKACLDKTITAAEVTEFLLHCYNKNDYEMSLSGSELKNLLKRFPNDVLVFTAVDKNILIGVAVVVRVSSKILYYFLSAFLPEYRTLSPMVLIIEKIYGFCQHNDFTILDLGTSLDHEDRPKPSLAKFKEHIGAQKCVKITYELNL